MANYSTGFFLNWLNCLLSLLELTDLENYSTTQYKTVNYGWQSITLV